LKRFLTDLVFAAGLAASVWLILHLGLRPVGRALSEIGVGGVLLVALAHLPALALLGLAWGMLAHAARGPQPVKFIWGRVMRDAGGELLPLSQLGGIAIGARAMALAGVPAVEATVTSLLDLFIEQLAKTPYAVAAVALTLSLVPGAVLAGPALAVVALTLGLLAVMAFRRRWVRARLLGLAARLDQRRLGVGSGAASGAAAAMAEALAPGRRLGFSLGLHALAWTLGAVEAWVALRLLGVAVSPGAAVVIDGLFVTFRLFAFAVPAAVGVQEGLYVVLCGLFGVDAPTALAFSLVRRARDLVIGAPALVAWQVLERRKHAARMTMGPLEDQASGT
jgi:putative membrane protein